MKQHPRDILLDDDKQTELDALLSQRKSTTCSDGSGEYQRLTAKIRYLRYGPESIYVWREKNKARISYERTTGIGYQSSRVRKPLTPEQQQKRNEACYRHDQRNPQRKIRRDIERILQMTCHGIVYGRKWKTPPRRAEALWGCDVAAFKRHIKDQLIPLGFTWSDWKTKWTLDHVVPVRKFDLPREQFACWHYTNIRPLPKHLNHRGYRG